MHEERSLEGDGIEAVLRVSISKPPRPYVLGGTLAYMNNQRMKSLILAPTARVCIVVMVNLFICLKHFNLQLD